MVCLCLLAGLFVGGTGQYGLQAVPCLMAEEELLKPRRLYVPDEYPLEWPRGDWRPITRNRLLRQLGEIDQAGLERTPPPLKEAHYTCRLEAEGILRGSFQAELQRRPSQASWVDLGRTNLWYRQAQFPQSADSTRVDWGTARDGRLFLRQPPDADQLAAEWKLRGVPIDQGHRYELQMLQAVHNRFVIELPSSLSLNITEPENPAVFSRQISEEAREWTIHGLERSRLTFSVVRSVGPGTRQSSLSRQVHLLSIAPSEQSFTSDFKLEYLPSETNQLEILLPDGFQPDAVQWQQETINTWSLRPVSEEDADQILTIHWRGRTAPSAATIRVRGRLDHFRGLALNTEFPRLLDTLDLETQVSVAVQAPYLATRCQPTGMEQVDARFVGNVRDVWSFVATSGNPALKLETTLPRPELSIDQLMVVRAEGNSLGVDHMMLWTTDQDRLFNTDFQLAPGFEVRHVAILSEDLVASRLTWTTLRVQNRDILSIHLANQLVPGQVLPIVVSLRTKLNGDRTREFSLPVLTPLGAEVRNKYLVREGVELISPAPEERELPRMTSEEARTWGVLSQLSNSQSRYQWNPDWQVHSLAGERRVRIRPLPIREDGPEASPGEDRQELPLLQTRLLRDGDRPLVSYRVEIPPALLRARTGVYVTFSEEQPSLVWRRLTGGPQAEQVPLGKSSVTVRRQVDRDGLGTYHFHWGEAGERRKSLVWEAYWQPSHPERFLIPLPACEQDVTYRGSLHWNPNDFTLSDTLTDGGESHYAEGKSVLAYATPHAPRDLEVLLRKQDAAYKSAGAPEPIWRGEFLVLTHPGKSRESRIIAAYRAPAEQTILNTPPIRFREPVWLSSVTINDWRIPVQRWVTEYPFLQTTEPVRQVTVEYRIPQGEHVTLPQPEFRVDLDRMRVCLPGDQRPPTGTGIDFWNPIPQADWQAEHSPLMSLVLGTKPIPPGQAESKQDGVKVESPAQDAPPQAQGELRTDLPAQESRLFSEFVTRHGYQIYEGDLRAGTAAITFPPRPQTFGWGGKIWLFVTTLLLGLLWLTYGTPTPSLLWGLTTGVLLGVWLGYAQWWGPYLAAGGGALLLLLHVSGVWQRVLLWWRTPTDQAQGASSEMTAATAAAMSAVLFRRTAPFWLGVWLGCGYPCGGLAQVGEELQQEERAAYDILIPVEAARMRDNFRGLAPEDYPDVVYISAELARKLNERSPVEQTPQLLLYESAEYTARWTAQNQLLVRCEFSILETARQEGRDHLILPLTNIAALTTLQAMVNGRPTTMIPLPDGTGLEIPLPDEGLEATESVFDQVLSEEVNSDADSNPPNSSPRRFVIELEVIAAQEQAHRGTRARLFIPAVANSQCRLGFPAGVECDWERSRLDPIPLRRSDPDETVSFALSGLNQLSLLFHSQRTGDETVSRQPGLQTDLLLTLQRNHLDVKLNTSIQFGPDSARTLSWRLPREMIVRNWHAPGARAAHLEEGPNGQPQLTIHFADNAPETTAALIRLVSPLTLQDGELQARLPQLLVPKIPAEEDLKWQVSLQSEVAGELTKIEFPDTPSSRIPRETFLATWPDADAVNEGVQCFRVRNPRRLKAYWQAGVPAIQVEAHHELRVRDEVLELNSQYRARSSGVPSWRIPFTHSSKWTLQHVQVQVDGREIPARILLRDDGTEIALSDKYQRSFEIQARWRQSSPTLGSGRDATPPRMSGTSGYLETSQLMSSEQSQWILREHATDGPSTNLDLQNPLPAPIRLTADSAEELDALRLDPVMRTPVRPETAPDQPPPLPSDGSSEPEAPQSTRADAGTTPPGKSTAVDLPSLQAATRTPQRIRIDHSLWREGPTIVGETLVLWARSDSRRGDEAVRIQLPESTEVLAVGHAAALELQQTTERLLVREVPGDPGTDFRHRFLLVHWRSPAPVGWRGGSPLAVPTVTQAENVSWRLLAARSGATSAARSPADSPPDTQVSTSAWRSYLDLLEAVGQRVPLPEEQALPTSVSEEPFLFMRLLQDEERSAVWPESARVYYRELPVQRRDAMERGARRLRPLTWTIPTPLYFADVIESGHAPEALSEIRLKPVSKTPIPWSLLIMIVVWGGGFWWHQRSATSLSDWTLRISASLLFVLLCLNMLG